MTTVDQSDNLLKTINIIVKGKVQGVGFRNYVMTYALKNNITGWVKNDINARIVEIVCTATSGDLKTFVERIQKGPSFSRIEKIDINDYPLEKFDTFVIK